MPHQPPQILSVNVICNLHIITAVIVQKHESLCNNTSILCVLIKHGQLTHLPLKIVIINILLLKF